MGKSKIKVILAEDHEMFRELLARELIEQGIDVIAQAENGLVLLEKVSLLEPDIVLLDLRMPEMDGHEVLKIFSKKYPKIKTIILSSDYSEFYVANVIINGASAYIAKNRAIDEVIKAINAVYNDGYYFNELISQQILEVLHSQKKIYYLINDKKFSEREIQVIQELCKDITPSKIAENLNISENTVQYHKNNIKKKTESETIISLVRYAIRQGIISDP